MPVEVYWEGEDRQIFCWELRGRWTWDEFFEAQGRADNLTAAVDRAVDVIVDLRRSEGLPPNAMSNVKRAMDAAHARKTGAVVILGADVGVHYMFKTFAGVFRLLVASFAIHFAATLDEAHRCIDRERARRATEA